MPTLRENFDTWTQYYDWSQKGEEWSEGWGGSEAEWFGSIYPRVHAFLPAGTIVEIAPGYGRWTHFLKNYCSRLIGVDLAENCVNACKERFSAYPQMTFFVNDGKLLPMIPDESVDFVYSFDSLVHVDTDVMESYLKEIARILKKDGAGFIHHANFGQYREILGEIEKIPAGLKEIILNDTFKQIHLHNRSNTMTARLFEEFSAQAGLLCIGQELINWNVENFLVDTISLITKPGSKWARPNRIIENPDFMKEIALIGKYSRNYTLNGFT